MNPILKKVPAPRTQLRFSTARFAGRGVIGLPWSQIASETVESARKAWQGIAERQLDYSLKRYLDAISVQTTHRGTVVFELTGDDPLPQIIEEGTAGFDMKPGLLNGRQVRVVPLTDKYGHVEKFRAVTSQSSGWIYPAKEGMHLVEQAIEDSGFLDMLTDRITHHIGFK